VTSKATPIVRSPSTPIKAAESQVVDVVHAETLGGGSAVNAMLVTRGTVGDFNHWAELGHPSWDYASLKPYFIKSEKSLSQTSGDRGYSGAFVYSLTSISFLTETVQAHWSTRPSRISLSRYSTSTFTRAPTIFAVSS
jgi:choline dehydrogenase-like flavoprotein